MIDKISNVIPFILCGGSGTRLFPLSRRDFPKQFVKLNGELSLFQQTVKRITKNFSHIPVILTGSNVKFIAQMQAKEIGCDIKIMVEPSPRNSGPAVLVAALYAESQDSQMGVAVFASDHIIEGDADFESAITYAAEAVKDGYITTFGIVPDYPATGYGYIKPSQPFSGRDYRVVERFVEKPNLEIAEKYIVEGYVWNSGNFMFPCLAVIDAYKKHDLSTFNSVKEGLQTATSDLGMINIGPSFNMASDLSIDYAVMEKSEKLAVVPSHFGWSDAGTWSSLYEIGEKDDAGNVINGDVLVRDTHNCLIRNDDNRLITMIGLDNITVVSTNDVLTITSSDRADEVKEIVSELKKQERQEAVTQSKVYRPWGFYETIAKGLRYQVKRITVYPDGRLSLQKHFHRAEHWVIVSGSAEITVDTDTNLLTENQSIYIPLGAVHRLYNPGKVNLELIEVQSGSYLGEDDIVRLQDDYARR